MPKHAANPKCSVPEGLNFTFALPKTKKEYKNKLKTHRQHPNTVAIRNHLIPLPP